MSVSEENIPTPVAKRLHVDVNLPENINPGEITVEINISFKPKPTLSEIVELGRELFKDSTAFQGDSVELVRKMRDGEG